MTTSRLSLLYIASLAMFVSTNAAFAQEVHFDLFLSRPAVGAITVTGGADVDRLAYDDEVRVFEVELGDVGGEFLALEPGVNHPNVNDPGLSAFPSSAAGLEPGDTLRLLKRDFGVSGMVDDLFFWNGIGSVSFAPATPGFRIDGGDPLGAAAGVGGVFDDHPFLVVDSTSLPGIYLASAVGVVDGYDPSDPVFLVMGTEGLITADYLGISQGEFDLLSDEDLDEALEGVIEVAVEYVKTNLVVPEPCSLSLAGVVCAVTTVAMRRRDARH